MVNRYGVDVYLPERALASVDLAMASLHAQIAQDQVALFLALGGGWEEAPS